jgi:hypothetical protein
MSGAVDTADFDGWVWRYLKAWDRNDPDDIIGLFSTRRRLSDRAHRSP